MTICPVISLMLTFWLYTNKQMFGNKIDIIQTQDDILLSHHLITELKWKEMTQP